MLAEAKTLTTKTFMKRLVKSRHTTPVLSARGRLIEPSGPRARLILSNVANVANRHCSEPLT